jgi:nitrogen fixation protein FixH
MNKIKLFVIFTILFSLALLSVACGGGDSPASTMKPIQTKKTDDNLTVTLANDTGKLKSGKQELTVSFTDASNKPAEITAATLNFSMPAMGSMSEMNNAATLTTTTTAGQFKGTVNVEMKGEWQAQITYEGKSGKGKISFPVTAN